MICLRCGAKDGLNQIVGLSFNLSGVEGRTAVTVTGIHCGKCGFLGLEMHPAAAPEQATRPIK